mmetsp:Transcript_27736/g.80044  ORF Transcript_27736/g.80044 Transcript_27736/m.80044 type:complete len:226 (+) Transcript_27736:801-1478(+)
MSPHRLRRRAPPLPLLLGRGSLLHRVARSPVVPGMTSTGRLLVRMELLRPLPRISLRMSPSLPRVMATVCLPLLRQWRKCPRPTWPPSPTLSCQGKDLEASHGKELSTFVASTLIPSWRSSSETLLCTTPRRRMAPSPHWARSSIVPPSSPCTMSFPRTVEPTPPKWQEASSRRGSPRVPKRWALTSFPTMPKRACGSSASCILAGTISTIATMIRKSLRSRRCQ